MFVQNAEINITFTDNNQNIWIENSCVGEKWNVTRNNIVTGVPQNDWQISLMEGQCVDIVPVGESEFVVRPYGYDDSSAVLSLTTPYYIWDVRLRNGLPPVAST